MAKKKNKQQAVAPGHEASGDASGPARDSASKSAQSHATKTTAGSPTDGAPALIICRNKHWRYISSFHGPWLQMPIEILETIANVNYNAPRPRPIDPAVLFDLVKIRRLVDDATNLAVRAASDTTSPALGNLYGGLNGHAASALGFGGGGGAHGTRLSRERKFRMREQAAQKLARAYRFDEIACSVATMQGASTLEEIGSLVLQRNPADPDAKYVHFFHEKIPSRQLAASTSLTPLREIIDARPTDPETWRTRATVRIFKEDYEGAAMDLTQALQVHRFHRPQHVASSSAPAGSVVLGGGGARRPPDVVLSEDQQPSSLETQLLFQRAGVYLTIACQHVAPGLPHLPAAAAGTQNPELPRRELSAEEKDAARRALEHRKLVKTYAKRASRDYMAYLAQFDYTPDLPVKLARDFTEKVNMSAQGNRHPRLPDSGSTPAYTVYPLPELFNAVPPPDLPPYPPQDVAPLQQNGRAPAPPPPASNEAVAYHPLLTDALHSLLLCHCLIQTSAKELLRHAYMVARLARLADGYPVFQASRSPARADWLEVLRRANNWLQISPSWEQLCAPAPLPALDDHNNNNNNNNDNNDNNASKSRQHHPAPDLAAAAAAAVTGVRKPEEVPAGQVDEQQRRERIRQRAIMETLEDDRVVDEATFRAALTARQNRAEADHLEEEEQQQQQHKSRNGGTNGAVAPKSSSSDQFRQGSGASHLSTSSSASSALRRWSVDDGREYPILTERAAAVARWVMEAPAGAGVTRRKKKGGTAKKEVKAAAAEGSEPVAQPDEAGPLAGAREGVANLALDDAS